MCDDKKIKRMDKPLDSLAKRQSVYAGDVMHEFFGLPGKYVGPLANEYPNVTDQCQGSTPHILQRLEITFLWLTARMKVVL